jgi:protease-4
VGSRQEYYDTTGGISEKYHSLSKKTSANKIAVLNASGMITTGDGFVKRQIDRIRDDESVKGIVLRIDSPGGSVYGSDFIFHHLKKLRADLDVPMVVSMGSLAASGGYYIAMAVGDQENCIYAEPLTTTGSIGVIIPHYNVAGLMEKYDIVDDSLATHPRKTMLSMTRPMTQDDRAVLNQYIGHAFDRFKDVIKEGRPKFVDDPAALDELATGEVFTAEQAKQFGLIDQIGFVDDAIARVLEMANLDEKETRVVTYTRPVSVWGAMIGKAPKVSEQAALISLLELNTQQAYYLGTPIAHWLSADRD